MKQLLNNMAIEVASRKTHTTIYNVSPDAPAELTPGNWKNNLPHVREGYLPVVVPGILGRETVVALQQTHADGKPVTRREVQSFQESLSKKPKLNLFFLRRAQFVIVPDSKGHEKPILLRRNGEKRREGPKVVSKRVLSRDPLEKAMQLHALHPGSIIEVRRLFSQSGLDMGPDGKISTYAKHRRSILDADPQPVYTPAPVSPYQRKNKLEE